MNTKITSYCATLLLAATVWLNAGETPAPKPGSQEFERMKTLVGTWKGKTDMGQGPVDITTQYRLLAAGSVLDLAGLTLVGGDVVDVSPPWDTTGATAIAGAHVAYELVCLYPWATSQARSSVAKYPGGSGAGPRLALDQVLPNRQTAPHGPFRQTRPDHATFRVSRSAAECRGLACRDCDDQPRVFRHQTRGRRNCAISSGT